MQIAFVVFITVLISSRNNMEDVEMMKIIIPSAVTLFVAIVGIVSTCIAAKTAARNEMEKSIILRFVDMFETAVQGLSTVSDVYANLQILFDTPMPKEVLSMRLTTVIGLSQECVEAGKVADPAILRLNVYFPDSGHDCYDSRMTTQAILRLITLAVEIDQKMKEEKRLNVTDIEYARYQEQEKNTALATKPLQQFYNARRAYFIQCYALWRKKNLPFLKGV